MNWQKEVRHTLKLAWPIALGNMSHILMGLIDNVMVGRLGKDALAAISFSSALLGFLIIVSVGMTAAMSPLVAKAKGAGRESDCGTIFYHGLVLNTAGGIFFAAVLIFLSRQLQWFGQPAEILPMARDYLEVVGISLVVIVVFNSYRQYSEGLSIVKPMLLFLFGSLGINAFLNWLWIFGHWGFPAMGVRGAAWATLVARLIMGAGLILFVLYFRTYRKYNIPLARVRWSVGRFREYLAIGVPGSLQYCAEASAFTGAAVMMGWIGTTALAAHQIAINLASMTFMFALGTSIAAAVRVGGFYGGGHLAAARQAGFAAIFLGALTMTVCGVGFYFGRFLFPGLYIDNAEVVAVAAQLMAVAAFFQFFDGAQGVAMGALRGLLDARWPTAVTVLAYWVVSIPLGYLMAIRWQVGAVGVWYGLLIGLAISSTLLMIRFHLLSRPRAVAAQRAVAE